MAFIGTPEKVVEVELPQRAPSFVPGRRREEEVPAVPELVPVRREVRQG